MSSESPPECKKKYRSLFCSNCGKKGHEYKYCTFPVISTGIILLKINFCENNAILSSVKITNNNGVKVKTHRDAELFNYYKDCISFLLIRRKHSLGFVEFIRGRYKSDNIDGIIFLFQQMTQDEINLIRNNEFDELWNGFWGDSDKKKYFQREYSKSKDNFEKLKESTEFNIDFFTSTVKPEYNTPEWGFPKGRRGWGETDFDCAKREVLEETGLHESAYTIINNGEPVIEDLTGTNGIKYRHIYFIGYLNVDDVPKLDPENKNQNNEIGDIGLFSYDEAMKLIRTYHYERRNIITSVLMFYCEQFIKSECLFHKNDDENILIS